MAAVALLAILSFALSLTYPDTAWFVQIARSLRNEVRFPGTVLAISIAGQSFHDGPVDGSTNVRAELLASTPLLVTLRPGGVTRRTAPIVRIVDADRRSILMLAQRGRSLLLTMSPGADRLRVRPPMIELPAVFTPSGTEGDTLTVAARRLTRGIIEHAFSFTWFAALLLPVGWWSSRAGSRARQLAFIAVSMGIAIVPHTFGLSRTGVLAWLAAVAGVAAAAVTSSAHAGARDDSATRGNLVEPRPQTAASSRHRSATA